MNDNLPWIEKHRPTLFKDIIDNDDKKLVIERMIDSGNLPHMIFTGNPGTGKTSTAIAICIKIFGISNYKNNILELNASDERGIETVRSKIPAFAKISISSIYKYKIIILDEADAMTSEAQNALRRVMEIYMEKTRFILICNNMNNIIDGLQSRCVKIHFSKARSNNALIRLREICAIENVNIKNETLMYLLNINKDFRQILGTIQCLHTFNELDEITIDNINKYNQIPSDEQITKFMEIIKTNTMLNAIKILVEIHKNNEYNLSDLLDKLIDVVIDDLSINDTLKIKIISKMSDVKFKVSKGYDSHVHLISLIASFYEVPL